MCQLTIVSTRNPRWSKILLTYQLFNNAKTSHKDGYGVMAMNERMYFFKSGLEPTKDSANLIGNMCHPNFKANTLLGHVRLASTVNATKILGKEKAHPFVDNKFILFHNGTLSLKKGLIPNGMTDSELFHKNVSEKMEKPEELMKTVIQEYTDNWEGKFAFIFPDLFSHNVYFARGDTAQLNQAELKLGDERIGILINTEYTSLSENLEFCKILFETALNIKNFSWVIKEIPRNSYFVLDDKIFEPIRLGDFKEQAKVWDSTPISYNKNYSRGDNYSSERYSAIPPVKPAQIYSSDIFQHPELKEAVRRIKLFCHDWAFTATDVNFIIKMTLEIDAENLSTTDITTFANLIIPKYEKKIMQSSRKVRSLWRKIASNMNLMGLSQLDFLYDNGLEYPFFMNSRTKLQTLYNAVNCIDCNTLKVVDELDDDLEEESEDDLGDVFEVKNLGKSSLYDQDFLLSGGYSMEGEYE